MVYKAEVDNLDNLLADVEMKLEEFNAPMKYVMAFLVAVEEIFVNVASYAYPDAEGDVNVILDVDDKKASITFEDSGIEFNPLDKADPDVNASAEDRPVGGLGIYMVKKSMDGVEYIRKDDKNIFTFWKNFEG